MTDKRRLIATYCLLFGTTGLGWSAAHLLGNHEFATGWAMACAFWWAFYAWLPRP